MKKKHSEPCYGSIFIKPFNFGIQQYNEVTTKRKETHRENFKKENQIQHNNIKKQFLQKQKGNIDINIIVT